MASFAKQESRSETARVADHQRKRMQEVNVCHSATAIILSTASSQHYPHMH